MNLYNLHTNPESLFGFKDRWKIPEIAYAMAKQNPGVRNPKLERVIMQNSKWAYRYAYDILNDPDSRKKQRWQEAEPRIMRDPLWAYLYALNILKGRWADIGNIEAEDYIKRDVNWWNQYKRYFRIQS